MAQMNLPTRSVLVLAFSFSLILSMGSVGAISALGVTNDGNIGFSGNQMDKGISFIAFCSTEGVDEGHVDDITGYNFDEDGNPRTVSWDTSAGIDAVVMKAGTGMVINWYDPPATNDTVPNSETESWSAESNDPCPAGMTGVKFEFDGDIFEEV